MLPNGKSISARLCQQDNKALMSNPNSELGEWLLRDVLRLKKREIVTYKKLEAIGIDTVEVNKFIDGSYEINFKKLGTYEKFLNHSL